MTPAPTDPTAATARAARPLLALVLAMLCVAAFARFSYLGQRFVNDPGLYAAMGKAVVEGRQLYVEIWDTKLPGITLLTAPLYAALRDRWWAWVAVQFAMMLAAVGLLAGAAARATIASAGDAAAARRARLATAAVGLALINIHWLLVTGFQLETPMLACASLGAWATIRAIAEPAARRAFLWALLAGVGGGMAATLKPTALAVSGAGMIALLEVARRGELPRAARLAAGLFVGLAAMLLVNVVWYHHLDVWPYLGEVLREINLYGTGTPWRQILSAKTVLILGILAWPAVVIGAARLVARDAPTTSLPGAAVRSAALALAATWLAAEVVGTILQKRGYAYHFLPIAAPATLLAGLLAATRGFRPRGLTLAVAVAVLPAALYSVLTAASPWREMLSGRPTYPAALVSYIRANTAPGDTIFADPVGELVVMTDRRPGSRVAMLIAFVNHDDAPEKFSTLLLEDLEARRCTVVLLPIPHVLKDRIAGWESQPVLSAHPERLAAYRAAWRRFIGYVHANYTREAANIDGREVWRRKPAPTTQP